MPPGRQPCTQGPGWTLLAVHWSGGSTSARVDRWDAPCDYSIDINAACGAFARCRGAIPCRSELTDGGEALLLDGSDDMLLRFSVDGLFFDTATVYFEARGTRGNAQLEVWSPLYGGLVGPIGGLGYEIYALDWSDFLRPGDEHGLTGIRFDATQSHVALHAVEVCLQ